MRSCLVTLVLFVHASLFTGCSEKAPPPPTAAEAAKTPPLAPPTGAGNSTSVSD